MAKGVAMFFAALFTLASAWGFYFHFSVGPSHGPGLELGLLSGVLALVSGGIGFWLNAREGTG